MPSTIGHALAGVAAAWTADLVPGRRGWRTAPANASWYLRAGNGLTVACAVIAGLPDLDLLLHVHRTFTHSLGAVIFVGLFAAALAANANRPVARVGLTCAAAYGTHLLLDWMAVDFFTPRGIQALWPFSSGFFISGWDLFRKVERRELLSRASIEMNLLAIAQELLLLTPVVVAIWLVRVKALAGLAAQLPGRDHPAE